MIKFNREQLVIQAVVGEISHPAFKVSPYRVDPLGIPKALPGVGSISYNVKLGDCVTAFKADHVEPGVSIKNKEKGSGVTEPNFALNFLACIGNRARVITGDAKDELGFVIGKHGGIEHVMIDFPAETLEKLVIGDKIQIKACGLGMELTDFPQVKVMNLDPDLLDKMDLNIEGGKLIIPVTHHVPAKVLGSGLGHDSAFSGDHDIQLFDEGVNREFNLESMCFGDLVAVIDADHSYGRIWRKGAISVGVIVHSACTTAGHGPGVTTLFTSTTGAIEPVITPDANLKKWIH